MLMTPKNDNESTNKKKPKKGESGATEEEETVRLLSEEPLDWMLKNEKVVSMLSDVRDRELPNKLISMVQQMNHKDGDADCVFLLLCKLKPFIWGMQKAVDERIEGDGSRKRRSNDDDKPDFDHNNIFFKFVPSAEEFKNNGVECEESYRTCKLF